MALIWQIFWRFIALGCVSFGGPVAHIGYFQREFVQKRKWISDQDYGRLVALSQFLPGPGSSQVGFGIGLQKAGLAGGIAAFLGFTLPSVLLLCLLAAFSQGVSENYFFTSAITGLKLFAVVVVIDAIIGMYNKFCGKPVSSGIAVATAIVLLVAPGLSAQFLTLFAAAVAGSLLLRPGETQKTSPVSITKVPLILFVVLLVGLPLLSSSSAWLKLINDFYQAGSWVFGGGHVVLPLLQAQLGDTITADSFLTGYAAAQAVPGPMFTLATFLGAEIMPENMLAGALLATVAVFLPGFLLILAFQKAWFQLASQPKIGGAANGINASVVGLLMAALYQPVFTSAVHSGMDIAWVVGGLFLLRILKLPILALIAVFVIGAILVP